MPGRRKRSTKDSTTLDRFGRVLLPKPVRDRLGLKPGDTLRIEVRDGELSLLPASAPSWEMRNGFAVWTGPVPDEAQDIVSFLDREREARDARRLREDPGE